VGVDWGLGVTTKSDEPELAGRIRHAFQAKCAMRDRYVLALKEIADFLEPFLRGQCG
jgi:hypothetical protein